MPEQQQSAYRQIVKATSIFGGVQVFSIIISLIRSKFVAVLLGPVGMGISGLFYSTNLFIGGLTSFGLGTSAVKDIAAAYSTGNQKKVALIVKVFHRLVWATGIFGTLFTLVFSPVLSKFTFGNYDYTIAFIWISITMLFGQLSSGQLVILQGMRKFQHLAKASIFGSFFGLIITLPLYYWYGIDGIVPAIILTSLSSFLVSWFYGSKEKIENIKVSYKTTLIEGKGMLIMGFVLSINWLIVLGTSYIVRIYVSSKGGLGDVGLYSAGFSMVNTYIGMIFSAMLTDYYPRLSAVAHDNKQCKETVNQQTDITLLIFGPLICIFLVFIKLIIIVLLSRKFLAITDMLNWAMLGVFFKAASWPIGFIFIPKGNSKMFLFSEIFANAYMLLFNILGYLYLGLEGLGLSFLMGYIVYFIQVYIIARIKYQFSFAPSFYYIFIIPLLLAISCLISIKFIDRPLNYIIGFVFIAISTWFSYKKLDKLIGIKNILQVAKNKFFNKNIK
jgi:O-antigen/teichoic acid export membrane protein